MLSVEKINTFLDEHVKRFIDIPYSLYENQQQWVPPVRQNIALYLNRDVHPIHKNYDVDFFLVCDSGQDIGRIMVFAQKNNLGAIAHFSLFECRDNVDAAKRLFDVVFSWASERKLTSLSGPYRLDFTEGDGILIEGFEYSQIMNMTPYHPAYYANLLEKCGFIKELDFTSSHITTNTFDFPKWLTTLATQFQNQEDIQIKSFSSLEELSQYIPAILQTLQNSLQQNENLNSADTAQVAFSVQQLLQMGLQPKFIKAIIYQSNMVGVILGFPDFSQVLRECKGNFQGELFHSVTEKPKGLVINGFGIISQFQMKGWNALLFHEMANMVKKNNIETINIVQITETNQKMQKELQSLGIPTTQRHRRYICQIDMFSSQVQNRFLKQEQTLMEIVQNRELSLCEKQRYIFLSGDNEEINLSFVELSKQAQAIAAHLQLFEQKPVVILLSPGINFIKTLLACLYANVIVVPCYPITQNTKARSLAIIQSVNPGVILSDHKTQNIAFDRVVELNEYSWLLLEELEQNKTWNPPEYNLNDIAVIQYTSGSTSKPKGVVLTHQNIVANVDIMQKQFGLTAETPGVCWLPPYHDMGLIGCILTSFYTGMDAIFMSPLDFLRKPVRWLSAISKYRAYVSGGPNFSYDLCVDKITDEQCKNLDLSCWKVAFNGAEPVRKNTLDSFCSKFSHYGFHQDAFFPCYGLAESTLIVTAKDKSSYILYDRQNKKTIVSCGKPLSNTKIIIVNPETKEICKNEEVGEIWIDNTSVARGYWKDQQATENIFKQKIPSYTGSYLRTGDLGFIKQGELFVCGRMKNLIIIRGQNYYPNDLESSALASHQALDLGAAFTVDINEEEQIVLAFELKRGYQQSNLDEIATAVRSNISANFQLEIYAVLFVKSGKTPRTTSGKIQHYLCREAFLNNTLPLLGQSVREFATVTPPVNSEKFAVLEKDMREQLAELLRIAEGDIDLDQPAVDLGLSSLTAVSLVSYVEEKYNFEIPMELFFEKTTLRELITLILNSESNN